ncbi:hypothetical protein B9Q00_07055, partial [Candidatus Marsarchaeota G1 archaeon OSP_C]
WDRVVLPSLLGGCVLTGGKRSDPDELVRGLHDALKPKLYYAYDMIGMLMRTYVRLRRVKPEHKFHGHPCFCERLELRVSKCVSHAWFRARQLAV